MARAAASPACLLLVCVLKISVLSWAAFIKIKHVNKNHLILNITVFLFVSLMDVPSLWQQPGERGGENNNKRKLYFSTDSRWLRQACGQPSVEAHSGARNRAGMGSEESVPSLAVVPRREGRSRKILPGPRSPVPESLVPCPHPRAPSAAVTERRNAHQEDRVPQRVPAALRSRCSLLTRLPVVRRHLPVGRFLYHPKLLTR